MESNTYKIKLQKLKGTTVTYLFVIGVFCLFVNKTIAICILLVALLLFFRYRKDPNNASALYHNLAINLYNKGEIAQAKQALKTSINYNKANRDAYFFLGCILFDEKDYKNALDNLVLGGAKEINDASLVYVLGICYYHVDDFDNCIKYLERISYDKMEPLEKQRLVTLGKAYAEKENYEKAYDILNKLDFSSEELKGDVLEYYYYLAVSSYYVDGEEAKELVEKIYNIDSKYKFIDVYAKELGIA